MNVVGHDSDSAMPREAPRPPAADIPGAIASTRQALGALTDSRAFEQLAVACLQEFEPSLRNTGGPGDEQRDGVAGPLLADDRLVLTVSLERTWARKIENDLDGLDEHGHTPELVVAVTNRRAGAKRRTELERVAPEKRGYKLRVIDVDFLALRLLDRALLPIREELLGLAPPQQPVAVEADAYSLRQPKLGAPTSLIGRTAELDELARLLAHNVTVEVIGPGGIGKTRLVLEAVDRIAADRILFLDDRARLDGDLLASELAGSDRLVLVVDNAHRRDDLHQVIGLLSRRTGPTGLILIARPGYEERLRQATDGTPLGARRIAGGLEVQPLGNNHIGELVRTAAPTLQFEGALEQIIDLAAGNPLIALLAHHVAVTRGGLPGTALHGLLAEYAASAVDTVVASRPDANADDLHDLLGVIAALGPVDPTADEDLLASLLGVPTRALRHRLEDLADAGLLSASGDRLAIAPDLLSAQILHDAHFSGRCGGGVRYREIWLAASEDQREAMCSALGGLFGFDVTDGATVMTLVGNALVELASGSPGRALTRAQSLAPGLAQVAVRVVDAALRSLKAAPEDSEAPLLLAMEVLSRVPEVASGWPRQLAVAQAFFALSGTEAATKTIHDSLTQVYKRLPINTSIYDGHVLAHVQEVLTEVTDAYWTEHRDQPGCGQTIAIAAGQLLTVHSERSYMSPEDDRRVHLSAGFLSAGERTAAVLRSGSRLLLQALPHLDVAAQQHAIEPLARLRRTANNYAGSFGSTPGEELVVLAGQIVDETAQAFRGLAGLALPTRARLTQALGTNPWPGDRELEQFLELLVPQHRRAQDREGRAERAEAQARALVAADDLAGELRRWQDWIELADEAGMKHLAQTVVSPALALATQLVPERMADALSAVLADGRRLNDFAGPAIAEVVAATGAEGFVSAILAGGSSLTRAAVAAGLVGSAAEWADDVLERLATDDEWKVRSAVAHSAGWTTDRSARRFEIGLRACLPSDLECAVSVLGARFRADGEQGALGARPAALVTQLVMNAMREPRLDGAVLVEVATLARQPRLVIDACHARIEWLAAHPANDLDERLARDSLPDELAEKARAAATSADRIRLMDLLEQPDIDSEARSTAGALLAWIDDYDAVTDRLVVWLEGGREDLHYQASRLLRETRDPDHFKQRAQRLLAADPPLDVTDLIIEARRPEWLVGSEKAVYRQVAAEFATWTDEANERLATAGAAGVRAFKDLAMDADDTEDDDEPEWG